MNRILSVATVLATASWFYGSANASAQVLAVADRAPRFYLASADGTMRRDAGSLPVLRRRISLALNHVSLAEALRTLSDRAKLPLFYSPDILPDRARVSLTAKDITVTGALTEILLDTGLDVVFSATGKMVLVERSPKSAIAQTGAIVGRLTDAKKGVAIPAAEVFLEGTPWRTTSDSSGQYRLVEVDTGRYTLAVRRLGYAKQSQRVTVRDGTTDTLNLTMEPVVTRLDELVTTATGRQRRFDVANDVTTINADSVMRTAPIRSVTDLLEGRVPGLTVQRTSGAPGDPARLRLRGPGSPLRSNDPIVVVDGVRTYADQSSARSANLAGLGDTMQHNNLSPYATPSPVDYIDPNSIETIEILKGPSAATLYGPDAANGIIVITTKRGKAGPTRWTANLEHGRTRLAGDYPELYLRWGHLPYNSILVACKIDNTISGTSSVGIIGNGTDCQGDSLTTFQLLNDPALTVLGKGHRTAFSLGASGGSQALTYAVTGSYQDEVGLPKLPDYEVAQYQALTGTNPPDWMRRPQHFKQWGVTSQLTARLGATADLSLTTRFSRTQQQRSELEQQLGSLMSTYLDPTTGNYFRSGGSGGIGAANDVLSDYFEQATSAATQFAPILNLNWRPRGWLTVNGDAGLDVVQRTEEIFLPRGAAVRDGLGFPNPDSVGHFNTGQGTSVLSTVNLRTLAIAPLGLGLRFQFAAGINYTGRSVNDLATQTRDVPPGQRTRGTLITGLTPSSEDNATFGWYLEPSLGHRKFSLSMGLRLDGSNSYGRTSLPAFTFPPKFPKVGFSYLLSDESWFPLKDAIQSFRLRVAYGRAGRQPGPIDRFRLYGASQTVYEAGQYIPAVFLEALGNTELRPERSTEFEGGFDTDLLNSRVTVTVSGYRSTTDDALLDVPLAPSLYGDGMKVLRNIGKIRKTGLEFTVGAQLLRGGPLTWNTQLAVSRNRNVVLELGPGVKPFYTDPGIRVAAGYPLFGRWSVPILGYADGNGNGILEPTEILRGDTAAYVGQTFPNYTASFSTTIMLWHGAVAVNAGFQYEDGVSQKNEVAYRLAPFSRGWNDPTASLAEQLANMQLGQGPASASDPGDYNWIQTVNTLRFNSLAVTYTVPGRVARLFRADRLSVAVQGGNLGLWTNYRGLDPAVNAFSTGNGVLDTGVLPQPRTWQLRVNATY